jgi:predicted DNA-binding antitoxin AbrB/MazE fold protein
MSTVVDAIYEDGVFKPERPVDLKEKTKVRLVIEDEAAVATEDDTTGWKAVDELVGFIKDGPNEPVGRDHDKYLYDK